MDSTCLYKLIVLGDMKLDDATRDVNGGYQR